jgi:hypothetical protein
LTRPIVAALGERGSSVDEPGAIPSALLGKGRATVGDALRSGNESAGATWPVGWGTGGERRSGGSGSRHPREHVAPLAKELTADPAQAFPGHGQSKPEQLEIERLRREVAKLRAERDILKKAAAFFAREAR